MKKILIVFTIVVLCVFSFVLGSLLNKNKDNESGKKEHNSPDIVIEGVWKAKHIELVEEKSGKEYYVVFQKGGNVYAIDDDGVSCGKYFDIGNLEESNFTLQIEDGPISLCKYENDGIQCELFEFIKKME